MLMNKNMRKFDIDKLDEYDIDELNYFKSEYETKIQSGEALINSLLNAPFKKEKINDILDKLDNNKTVLFKIKTKIILKKEINDLNDYSQNIITSNIHVLPQTTGNLSYLTNSNITLDINLKSTSVSYLDNSNNIMRFEVIDDIFQSILGNYYLVGLSGLHLPLTHVISAEKDSKIDKWFNMMSKKIERKEKLKRILK